MPITVNTNVSSLIVQNNLTKSTSALDKAMERMTTGLKINSAADDAAGLFIASKMKTQINGSEQAVSNCQIGNNLLQKTEGDISLIEDNVNRIRDLALQAMTGTNDESAVDAIKAEIEQRVAEINRLSASSEFNGKKLLNGTTNSLNIQVGPNASAAENSISISGVFGNCSTGSIGLGTIATITAAVGTSTLVSNCDAALTNLQTKRTKIGAYQNRFNSAIESLNVQIENLSSAKSTVMDADIAKESSAYVKAQILQQASSTLLASANQAPSIALSLI